MRWKKNSQKDSLDSKQSLFEEVVKERLKETQESFNLRQDKV